MTIMQRIEQFFSATAFGVVGASTKRHKYGNKVLRCYLQNKQTAIPVNPLEAKIEGIACAATVDDLPDTVSSLSIITPPQITEQIVGQAINKGIKNIWMQPGAESPMAIKACEEAGINLIADGSCLLVVLGYREN